jgi:hemolysin activation/secretion protein
MSRGKSKLYNIYANQTLMKNDQAVLILNLGFDYKDIYNFLLGEESSRDRLRIAKLGLDLDLTDNYGRTLITDEINYGIPDIMGGLKKRDQHAARSGSSGKFVKDNLTFIRLQRAPFDSILLWKNQLQFSPYILPSSEQFQLGGIANVRGYPPAEVVGDNGYSMTWEWSIPPYFVPRSFKVPFSKGKIYDSFRIVTFYDWANTRLRRPQAGEQKNKTLRAAGVGLRLNLPENFSARIEFAWPLDNNPSDGKHLHKWIEVTKSF